MNTQIIRGAGQKVYIADAETECPAFDGATLSEVQSAVAALSDWDEMGVGELSNDGVVWNFTEDSEDTTTLDSPRLKEGHILENMYEFNFSMVDLTPETYARIQNDVAVSTQAAAANAGGYRSVPLGYGFVPTYHAVLWVFQSALTKGLAAFVHTPRARVILNEGPTLAKSGDAMVGALVRAYENTTYPDAYGAYRVQETAPL